MKNLALTIPEKFSIFNEFKQNSVQVGSDDATQHAELAGKWEKTKQWDLAAAAYEAAVAREASRADWHAALARTREKTKQWDLAAAAYEAAVARDASRADWYAGLARTREKQAAVAHAMADQQLFRVRAELRQLNFAEATMFHRIRQLTNGYLRPAVYEQLYRASYEAPSGDAVDIGPAQGGSTISIGLGRREANLLTRIYSLDTFCGSRALRSQCDAALNIETLRGNLETFGLDSAATIVQVPRDNSQIWVPDMSEVAVLFIDADGALDRDFVLFYDRLVEGAKIIIDDYEDIVSDKLFAKGHTELERYIKIKGKKLLNEVNPLGKHYTVYKFVNYFVEEGLLKIESVVDSTVFGVKPTGAPCFDAVSRQPKMENIRWQIEEKFWALRHKLAA